MSLIGSLCCINCFQIYDENRKPCIGLCKDSICLPCIEELKHPNCPNCGRKDAFRERTINYDGIKLVEKNLAELNKDTIMEHIKNQAKKDSGPCGECSEHSNKLRICMDCAEKEGIICWTVRDTFYPNMRTNMAGLTFLGSFYKAKQFSICADCAQDGEHAEHKIRPLQDVLLNEDIDYELFMSFSHILMMKNSIEMEKNKDSFMKILYYFKNTALFIEENREKTRVKLPAYLPSPATKDVALEVLKLLRQLEKVTAEEKLLLRRYQMASVEWQDVYVQLFWKTKEAKKNPKKFRQFLKGMKKVRASVLPENEKLEGKELEKVNKMIRERFMKYCNNTEETVLHEMERGTRNLERVRLEVIKTQDAVFTAFNNFWKKYAEFQNLPRLPDKSWERRSFQKYAFELQDVRIAKHNAWVTLAKATIAFHEAYGEANMNAIMDVETQLMIYGGKFTVNHPNLHNYLTRYEEDFEKGIVKNSYYMGNVLHFL